MTPGGATSRRLDQVIVRLRSFCRAQCVAEMIRSVRGLRKPCSASGLPFG